MSASRMAPPAAENALTKACVAHVDVSLPVRDGRVPVLLGWPLIGTGASDGLVVGFDPGRFAS